MSMIPHDLRFGARMLAKRPGTTLLAVVTLAIGVGANTAAFSLLTSFLLRPLPFDRPDRVVRLSTEDVETGAESGVSLPDLADARDGTGAFEAVAAARPRALLVDDDDEPEQVDGADVTVRIGDVLGVRPALGRLFEDADARADAGVAVLGYGFWQRHFGSDPGAVGRTLVVDRRPVTVVGVLPPGVQFPGRRVDVWLPMPLEGADRADRSATAVARLASGVTVEDARGRLATVAERLAASWPDIDERRTLSAERLDELAVGKVRDRMVLLQVTVLFVLLIACANLASVRLALAGARVREVAVRAALGAGQWRVARQFLLESLLLAIAGGATGAVVASWMLRLLVAAAPDRVVLDGVGVDTRTLVFALAVSLGCGVAFGLGPALRAAAADPADVLRAGSAASAAGTGADRMRGAFLVVEVALTVVLLVGAALVMRAYWRLESVSPGFDPLHGVAVDVMLPEALAPDATRVEAFYRDAVERARAVQGVEAAGAVDIMPLVGWNPETGYALESAAAGGPPARADLQPVTPGYFRAMGIPVAVGRTFADAELDRREPVAIVNERFARAAWPGEEAVGRRLRLVADEPGEPGRWLTVVGVVGDVRQFGVQEEPRPEIYVPETRRSMTVVARTAGDPAALAGTISAAVRSAEPGLPRLRTRTLEDVVADALAVKRLSAIVFGTLAGISVLLASIGLYGLIAHSVARRTREIGVRMALGARPGDVAGLVLRQSLGLTAVGLALGLVGSLGLTRFLRAYLFGLSALDPLAFAGGSLVLVAVAVAATLGPVRSATRVDPLVALRDE
jgi:putative ABC transport system permease protein